MMRKVMELKGAEIIIIKACKGIKKKLVRCETSLTIRKFRNKLIPKEHRLGDEER